MATESCPCFLFIFGTAVSFITIYNIININHNHYDLLTIIFIPSGIFAIIFVIAVIAYMLLCYRGMIFKPTQLNIYRSGILYYLRILHRGNQLYASRSRHFPDPPNGPYTTVQLFRKLKIMMNGNITMWTNIKHRDCTLRRRISM